ncbi:MAG: FtsW/RodA/SpoVE family cell cycle protein [Clostridiales bacterium]|jgi:cell division protein FtsW (lipid II flippase)|nr:FtsW/RodA/SpoVE family cell cycle protein [Clostridiales bacterium]
MALDFFIIISRYIFLFLAVFFAANSAAYALAERGALPAFFKRRAVLNQRLIIAYTHISGFLILCAKSGWDARLCAVAGGGLAFVVAGGAFFGAAGSSRLLANNVFFLLDIGLIMLARLNPALCLKQMVFAAAGLGLAFFAPLLIAAARRIRVLFAAAGAGLLVLPFIAGVTIFGATNWVQIPVSLKFAKLSFSVSFQPSEFAKICYILYLSSLFSSSDFIERDEWSLRERGLINRNKHLIIPAAITASFIIILVLQRDLGGALMFFTTFIIMLYAAAGRTRIIGAALIMFAAAGRAAYSLFGHVAARFDSWRDPWADMADGGYQVTQALFAVSTWGAFGSGLTRGNPAFIPVRESDFIFAAICEEFGFFFGVCVIFLYITILYAALSAVRGRKTPEIALSLGAAGIIAFQAFLIIGGNIGLVPLTGVTLPFVSAGGSSVAASFVMAGLIMRNTKNIKLRALEAEKAEAEENGEEDGYEPE